MSAETWLSLIVGIVLFNFILTQLLDWLNLKAWRPEVPEMVSDYFTLEKLQKAHDYDLENKRLSFLSSSLSIIVTLSLLYFGGFGWLSDWAFSHVWNPIWSALLFFGVLFFGSSLLGIPFQLYRTFKIEEKYGFNKTTMGLFWIDLIKKYVLTIVIIGPLVASLIWIYLETQEYFWLYAWFVVAGFLMLTMMFYASLILPLFNKLTPLRTGELREKIEAFCQRENFPLDELFIMDASKRSAKGNAFFSGLGKKKRIVLFDTIVQKHPTDELVAILAHEIGHFKKKHTRTMTFLALTQTFIMFYLLSLVIKDEALSLALGGSKTSFVLGVIGFSFLYSPLSLGLGLLINALSRKNEFEADAFAKEKTSAEPMKEALKRLSAENLSNLYPHPLYVKAYHSHPPLLERLKALG